MEKMRDSIYLSVITRALVKIQKASGLPDVFHHIYELTKDSSACEESLIREAEALSYGDLEYPQDGYTVPSGTKMESLLEVIKKEYSQAIFEINTLPLEISDRLFPVEKGLGIGDIKALCQELAENVNNLRVEDLRVLAENILNLLNKFAVTVPASEKALDVSLYDQAKTAASIAVCLYDYQHSKESGDDEFLLIGGDFSGIQKYIYQIVSKYAGRNLKGRSFYLCLLSDAVVRYLINALGLYRASVVYNSGGCFYLLAPNTEKVRQELAKALAEIEMAFFDIHGTQLYVAIDSIPLSRNEVANNNGKRTLPEIWQQLFAKRDRRKNAPFSELPRTTFGSIFIPQDVDGNKWDAITGKDIRYGEKTELFVDNQVITNVNAAQIRLGQELKNADLLIVSDVPIAFLERSVSIEPCMLGIHYYLVGTEELERNMERLCDGKSHISIVFLNENNTDSTYKLMTSNICSIQFYGGNAFSGNTFEEMCENSSFSRLGVLRMDVDNLGSVFQSGIPAEKATFARFASLSRSFDYFFSGYINNICLSENRADRSFIIYSGGDDVFIVGSWETMIDIAYQIYTDFKRYTCGNPAFSISGGIAILKEKFPIIMGAEKSADEENKAKSHSIPDGSSKNSISFMAMPLNWDWEFPAVQALKTKLVGFLQRSDERQRLPKSFLSKIMGYAESAAIRDHKIKNFRVFWQLAYDIKRMQESIKDKDVCDMLDRCVNEICRDGDVLDGNVVRTFYNKLELWAMAARWAELEYRMLNN